MMARQLLRMDALRRLKQLSLVFNPNCLASRPVMKGFCSMNASSEDSLILRTTFSDINSNLLTSEVKCSKFMEHYNALPKDQRGHFLCELAKDYGPDRETIASMAYNVIQSQPQGKVDANFLTSCERMRSVLKPRYKLMLSHLGRVPGGVKFLVDLRAEVLSLKQSSTQELEVAVYQEFNLVLRDMLMMWFAVGFFNLERITWNSPCDLVQKVSNYEAVHRIRTWEDIKRRVGPYRRCYIFTHNAMPREPVVVLHTALTQEISSSIHSIIHNARFIPSLHHDDSYRDFRLNSDPSSPVSSPPPTIPPSPDVGTPPSTQAAFSSTFINEEKEDTAQINCAVFYSITSTQKGLQGIELGNYLIKSVVRKLQEEFPHLTQFSSLSPIPGFRDWLLTAINQSINKRNAGEDPGVPILLPEESTALAPYKVQGQVSPLDTFKAYLLNHQWVKDEPLTHVMSRPLLRLCAQYLYVQKRRNYALNPVANFHLSNGAVLWRINLLGDLSMRGLNQSCSLMVNYRYFLEMNDVNSRNYLENHQISASDNVLSLLKSANKNTA